MITKMDLYEICVAFTRLKMSPVFEVVHFVLMSLNMKKDLLSSGESISPIIDLVLFQTSLVVQSNSLSLSF